jgi:lipopolysaccharide heptosyltransferase II
MTTVPHDPIAGKPLVIFAPNWLGDAVMALPAIADVCRARRHAIVAVAARPHIMPLFELVDGIDEILDVTGPGLRSRSFDAALLLPNSFHAAITAWRAGIGERWGYRTQGRFPLLTRAVARGPRVHQVAYYQHLVSELGYPNGPMRPCINVSPAVRQAGADMLRGAGWDERAPLVAFAPGAANGRAKQWPPESFAGVARDLAQDGIVTVLVGTPADARAGTAVVEGGTPGAMFLNLIGRTNLPALAGVLAHCRGLVCNDSGAMHFGAALGVSVTALFGPSNEAETRPLGEGSAVVLTHDVWCRPCMLRECPLNHACMRGITVGEVVASARATFANLEP